MTTLFDSRLSDRDFSSHLLYVPDLLDWTKSKRLQLRTTPPIDGYEFVQVESLLCAIERKAGDLTTEQAFEIVANDPALNIERAAGDPTTARWLLGADAHRKWRELLSSAIAAHDLALLDFGSKLPIDTAPAQNTATPAPVVAASASGGTDQTPDPERRLARLRALGGTYKYARGEWKFTGIVALVESEKAEGRKRSDEKTIRADLKDAAQTERDAKSAGFGAGLGQR